MKNISIIVAIASNYAIGKDNDLLWHISKDLKRFKQITKDHYIYIENKNINLYLLESRLKNYFRYKKERVVFLKADKGVSYGYVISALDIIKKAGIEKVGIIVKEK